MNTESERMEQCSFEEIRICDLCGGTELAPEFVMGNWTLFRCAACGLVFTSPRYTETALLNMYESEYYEKARLYLLAQLEQPPEDLCRLADSLKKRLGRNTETETLRSLDVGCGGGAAVAAFKKAGWGAVGIDLGETAIKAGQGIGLDLRAVDLSMVEPHSFDAITVFHVLEHVLSPSVFLKQCAACLKPHGILVVEVPNYASRNSRRLRQIWPYLHPHLHLYQFTTATLKRYLTTASLEVTALRKIAGYGPAEDYGSSPGFQSVERSRTKKILQDYRHILFSVPGAKPLLRWLVWQALGYGEFIRAFCRCK